MRAASRSRISVGTRKLANYRGRRICADTDLHERAFDQVLRHAQPSQRVADIGCGEGAFSFRLADAGFEVVALDLLPQTEQFTDAIQYVQLDLLDAGAREGFLAGHTGSFDVVVLLEVIEHVHDPWETLAFARRLLREDGVLLLSTPNITSFYSRFRFLTSGLFHQFDTSDFSYGHVNPMTSLMVERVLSETGFELVEKRPGPPMPALRWDASIGSLPWRMFHAFAWLASLALIPLMRGGDLDGWSLFFVARTR